MTKEETVCRHGLTASRIGDDGLRHRCVDLWRARRPRADRIKSGMGQLTRDDVLAIERAAKALGSQYPGVDALTVESESVDEVALYVDLMRYLARGRWYVDADERDRRVRARVWGSTGLDSAGDNRGRTYVGIVERGFRTLAQPMGSGSMAQSDQGGERFLGEREPMAYTGLSSKGRRLGHSRWTTYGLADDAEVAVTIGTMSVGSVAYAVPNQLPRPSERDLVAHAIASARTDRERVDALALLAAWRQMYRSVGRDGARYRVDWHDATLDLAFIGVIKLAARCVSDCADCARGNIEGTHDLIAVPTRRQTITTRERAKRALARVESDPTGRVAGTGSRGVGAHNPVVPVVRATIAQPTRAPSPGVGRDADDMPPIPTRRDWYGDMSADDRARETRSAYAARVLARSVDVESVVRDRELALQLGIASDVLPDIIPMPKPVGAFAGKD